jgi:hypothetical protein
MPSPPNEVSVPFARVKPPGPAWLHPAVLVPSNSDV